MNKTIEYKSGACKRKRILALCGILVLFVIFSACGKMPDESDTFSIPVTFGDGTEGEYQFVGEEGKLGMLTGGLDIRVDTPTKYMWYFWFNEEEFEPATEVKIMATHIESEAKMEVVDVKVTAVMHENVHKVPSLITFPQSGLWRFETYLDEQFYAEIIVNVG